MREIKFKFFNKKTKVMSCEYTIERLCNGYFDFNGDDPAFEKLQFTGLKDKNGVEIYDGDIVNFIPMDMFGIVRVFNKSLCFGLEWVNSITEIFTLLFYLECEQELEVIGNIYENPELLNKG